MDFTRKYFLLFSVIGLTFISLSAGFDFYLKLFGLEIALLCCVVFEILRLGCLWSIVFREWILKFVAIPLYLLVSSACIFAAITSFHAKIIENHTTITKPYDQEVSRRIETIKRTYAQQIGNDLVKLDDKIDVCNRKIAWNPNSKYWKNRLAQLIASKQISISQRDSVLNLVPSANKERWISYFAAKLELKFEPLPSTTYGSKAVTFSIQELWGVTELRAKKIVAIIIIMITECGIILLSLLVNDKKVDQRSVSNSIISKLSGKNILINTLQDKFSDEEIQFMRHVILQRLYEVGMVDVGTFSKGDCFKILPFGRDTLC